MASTRIFESAAEAIERDPRRYPYGYLTGGTEHLDSVRVFVWFSSLDDLVQTLLEVEPRMYGVEPGRGLEEYQARVGPILERVRKEGLTSNLRAELAPEQDGKFTVEWWGHYADLREGRGVFGCRVLDEYLGEERHGERLPDTEEDSFVAYLGLGAA